MVAGQCNWVGLMSYFNAVRCLRLTVPVLVLGLLAACVTGTRKSQAPVSLYDQLDQASEGYLTALQQARRGDTGTSEKTLKRSLDQLRDVAVHCDETQGCDPQRFFSVFDHLLRLKDGSFIGSESPDDGDNEISEQGGDESTDSSLADGGGVANLSEAQRSVTLLHDQKLSDLIAMNGAVKAALEMWLTQWRPRLMSAYINYMYMRYEMWPYYKKNDLPEALLFGILAKESYGKVHVVSRSGAAGPFQFMYATGLRFGLGSVNGFDTRFDPSASARASARYLNEQLKIFNDNLELTLAAYNAGEGRMRRLVGHATAGSFYAPRIYDYLSQETRAYVPAVLAAAWLFLHPDSYNLRFPKINGAPGYIKLKRPASISELTMCLGEAAGMRDGWFLTLRNLNPRLKVQKRQPIGTVLRVPKLLEKTYALRCVDGPWPILASDLHNAVAPVLPVRHVRYARIRHYTVRPGDTLGGIAYRHSCASVSGIERLNGIHGHLIHVGQVIKLPGCHRGSSLSSHRHQAFALARQAGGRGHYTVRPGDTLGDIAYRYHCSSVSRITALNGIQHHLIRVGQVLKLPGCHE